MPVTTVDDRADIVRAPNSAMDSPAERLAFERLLADVLSELGQLSGNAMLDDVEGALYRLIEFLGFDRSSLGELEADGKGFKVTCSAAREGFERVQRGPAPRLPWFLGEIAAGRAIAMASMPEDLPREAVAEAEFCRTFRVRSNLTIPLRVAGQIVGLLSFSASRPMPVWPPDVVDRLGMVGNVFAQWIARSRREAELGAAHAEILRLKERLEAENSYLRQSVRASPRRVLTSHSPVFNAVLEEITQVAPTGSTVLLLGETGTGKEILADYIHAMSGRKSRQMVKISCAALPASLIEAELFGREKGAYTGALGRQSGRFEIADGSTIFLDEVGELPLELQPKLLRVLQDGSFERLGSGHTTKVDVRVIAATNRDLSRAVGEGSFREDLFYRLNVFPVALPPLRERRADIPLLAWEFVKEFCEAMGKPIERIADDSMAALQAYAWPGNIRELRNVIERAMILARSPTLHVALGRSPLPATATVPNGTLEDAERTHITKMLERVGWRVRGPGGAADLLGMKPTTLESRMKKLGVRRPGSNHR